MRLKTGSVMVVLLAALPGVPGAFGAEPDWHVVAAGPQVVTSVSTDSIRIREGHLSAWVMLDYVDLQDAAGVRFRSATELRIFDCANKRSGTASRILYEESAAAAKVVDAMQNELSAVTLASVKAGTTDAVVVEFVCARANQGFDRR